MIRVCVRLYAGMRERAGSEINVQLPGPASLADFVVALQHQHPALAALAGVCRYAREDAFLDASAILDASATLDAIPPVSGG
jgi:molybdopterin converting factor small subunit